MTEIVSINLKEREVRGKEAVKKLRAGGQIPVSFYGADYKEALSLQISKVEMAPLANSSHWETARIEAQLPSGAKELCLMREVQRNPLTDEILHIDLLQLVKGHKIKVNVPIEPVNKESCKGVKMGGVFEQIIHEVELEVLPREIPESISYDVSEIALGDLVHLSDLELPESAEIIQDPEEVVFTVAHARAVEEVTEEPEEPQEVEVVGKGKPKEEAE